jgi:LPS-assembly lipoprotein
MVLLLSACGFRLQGSGVLPVEFSRIYIDTEDRYTLFYQNLKNSLRQRGVTIVSSRGSADAVINVILDSSGKEITAVSLRNTPLEYQAFYRVTFSVSIMSNVVIKPATIALANRYVYDETKVLGKEEELEMLLASQSKDISRQILVQLSSL